jgi:hypothetical protein
VLDFQDAVYGPITYDIASLMRDAFLSWDEDFVLDITVRYWQRAQKAGLPVDRDFGEFYRGVEWMGLQRHLKVAGIFARLTLRDGKPRYLADTPRFIATSAPPPLPRTRALLRLVDGSKARRLRRAFAFGHRRTQRMPCFHCPMPLASSPASCSWPRRAALCRCCACSRARHHALQRRRRRVRGGIERMGRSDVRVRSNRTTPCGTRSGGIHLAVGMPANERMDLVEKATELGAAASSRCWPERSVLKLEASAPASRRTGRALPSPPANSAAQPRARGAAVAGR